ncbi:MAG: hypothetical protein QOE55_6040 [Acidobacteriaceae bacterium]|nr:hypothetical protein [Acidobacteriaceae bacterium]
MARNPRFTRVWASFILVSTQTLVQRVMSLKEGFDSSAR